MNITSCIDQHEDHKIVDIYTAEFRPQVPACLVSSGWRLEWTRTPGSPMIQELLMLEMILLVKIVAAEIWLPGFVMVWFW